MNPLGNGNIGSLSPQIMQNIQRIKGMMQAVQGNPMALLQQNPMLNQIMQKYQGQDLKSVFMNLAQEQGLNPEAIINELRR